MCNSIILHNLQSLVRGKRAESDSRSSGTTLLDSYVGRIGPREGDSATLKELNIVERQDCGE